MFQYSTPLFSFTPGLYMYRDLRKLAAEFATPMLPPSAVLAGLTHFCSSDPAAQFLASRRTSRTSSLFAQGWFFLHF